MFRHNTAGQNLGFKLVKVADGTPGTLAIVTVYRVIDGGAQAAATGTVLEKGNGQYNFAPSQADTNGNEISFLFVATGMILEEKTIVTTVADPTNAAFGLVLAKGTNLTGLNDIAATAIVTGGAIATASGAVATVATVSNGVGIGPGAISTASFAAGAIDAAAIAAAALNGKGDWLLASGYTVPPTAVQIRQEIDTNSAQFAAIKAKTDNLPATPAAVGSAMVLSSAGLDAITIETGVNARQALSPILAACAGVLAGAGTGTITIKGGNVPATTRITATTDSSGNRSSVTLALPT